MKKLKELKFEAAALFEQLAGGMPFEDTHFSSENVEDFINELIEQKETIDYFSSKLEDLITKIRS